MIDRKSAAAGDFEEYDDPREVKPLQKLQFKIIRCDRCGKDTESFRKCQGCEELDKLVCVCGGTGKKHVFSRGDRQNKRIWICDHCFGEGKDICTYFSHDPIKQWKKVDFVNGNRWEDILEERGV